MRLGDADFLRQDYVSARRFYESACDGGNGHACATVGFMHERGLGVVVDFATAIAFGTRSCGLGEGLGCNNVGWMHHSGKGVPVDDLLAAKLYRQACELRSPIGCRNLGSVMLRGQGTELDVAGGTELLDAACRAGDGEACLRLAVFLDDEHATKDAKMRAAAFYARGCDGDNTIKPDCHSCRSFSPESCYRLGRFVRAMKRKPEMADMVEKVMTRACQGGFTKACTEIEEPKPRTSP